MNIAFYATASYAARRELPKRPADLDDHDNIAFFSGSRSSSVGRTAATISHSFAVDGRDSALSGGVLVAVPEGSESGIVDDGRDPEKSDLDGFPASGRERRVTQSPRGLREAALVSAYAVDQGRVVSTEDAADLLEAETGFRVVAESPPELVPGACDRLGSREPTDLMACHGARE